MIDTEIERESDYRSLFPRLSSDSIDQALQLGYALNKLNEIAELPTYSHPQIKGMRHIAFSLYCDLRDEGAEQLGKYVLIQVQSQKEDPNKLPVITSKQSNPRKLAETIIYGSLQNAALIAERRWSKIIKQEEKGALVCQCLQCRQRYEEVLRVRAQDKIPDDLKR